jgi:hypothetical protein
MHRRIPQQKPGKYRRFYRFKHPQKGLQRIPLDEVAV